MRTIERNGKSKLKQKLPWASPDNGIKMGIVVIAVKSSIKKRV